MSSRVQAAPSTPAAQRPRGLVPGVVEALEQDLRSGLLSPGQKLPTESALVSRFAVSRTVIREAISRLQASGLVETRHGVGTFVLEPRTDSPALRIAPDEAATAADVLALLELRISLESESAALAAQRREDHHLAAMAAALATFEASMRAESDAVPSDFQFHMEIARASGNRYFAELMNHLGASIIPRARLRTAGNAPPERALYLQRVHLEHQNIYDAVRNRDSEAARAAMRLHLFNSRERLRRAQVDAPTTP